ncbi:MAG: endolytic transglycosylase MltG [Erysipelotrichaceae bacterium]|nr:endolytic transglycosylase MltG [Erysipelotrichaceae bacterium]
MKRKKIIGIIIGVIVVALIGSYFYYQYGISAVSSSDEEVIVDIEEGTSASGILDALDEAGLVNNKLCGKIFLKLNKYDNLQANSYIFNKNMSLKEIFDIIQNPTQEYINSTKLTIIEGSTMSDNATLFAEILGISEDEVISQWADTDFLNTLIEEYWFLDESILDSGIYYPLEGYLYPETYYIGDDSLNVEAMTRVALDMMDERLSPYQDQIEETGWSVHEFLTFCSVVEKESGSDESDRSMIAGVFKNRLDSNMLLQSDITVNYAWQRTGVDVSISQTQIDSKYNTYKYTGLPIGPICCVPTTTIESCLNYSEHDYYYFFAQIDPEDSSNTIVVYSKTYEEHQQKVQEAKDNDLWLS